MLYYLLCALLFPAKIDDYDGYADYFISRRHWFFGILAVIYAVDFIDTWIKGATYFASLGPEYPIRNGSISCSASPPPSGAAGASTRSSWSSI